MNRATLDLARRYTPQALKNITRRFRMFCKFRIKVIARFFPKYFGLYDLDRKLEKYLNYNKGYFIELGANDGVSQSNTKHFELFRNWKGVLVEPTPANFISCKRNRSRRSKVINAACVGFDFKDKTVRMLFSNLMTIALDGESDISDRTGHATEGIQFLDKTQHLYEFHAPARTLDSILKEARSPHIIDLLSLDVEGSEMEVLKGIDHSVFRFKYICIEVRDFDVMSRYLNENGYEFVEKLTGHDYLFRDCRSVKD